MSQPKLLDTLRANRFFEGMHEQELSELASIAQLEQHPKETVIFKEGGPSNKFFVVIEGSVGLEITIEGRAKRIHSVGACELLGWSPILGSKSMKATARTLATTTLISFDTLQCQALTERAPHLRSEEHTSELQSRGLISYAVFCLKKKKNRAASATSSCRRARRPCPPPLGSPKLPPRLSARERAALVIESFFF